MPAEQARKTRHRASAVPNGARLLRSASQLARQHLVDSPSQGVEVVDGLQRGHGLGYHAGSDGEERVAFACPAPFFTAFFTAFLASFFTASSSHTLRGDGLMLGFAAMLIARPVLVAKMASAAHLIAPPSCHHAPAEQ